MICKEDAKYGGVSRIDSVPSESPRCVECKGEMIYFADGAYVCPNKECKLYAPKTYTDKDLSKSVS